MHSLIKSNCLITANPIIHRTYHNLSRSLFVIDPPFRLSVSFSIPPLHPCSVYLLTNLCCFNETVLKGEINSVQYMYLCLIVKHPTFQYRIYHMFALFSSVLFLLRLVCVLHALWAVGTK